MALVYERDQRPPEKRHAACADRSLARYSAAVESHPAFVSTPLD